MIKVKYWNIVIYIFTKYLFFYIFMMFKNNDFTLIALNKLKTSSNWLYYFYEFSMLPIIISILFSAIIYRSFRVKNRFLFLFINIFVLTIEYFLYTYFASQLDLLNGIYNVIISLIIFVIFFYKAIALKLKYVSSI